MTALAERSAPPRTRSWPAVFLLVAAVFGAVFAMLPGRSADPELIATTPGMHEDGRFAREVRLTFDREVPAALATVQVTAPTGESLVSGRPFRPADAGPDTVAVAMPETVHQGTYHVSWAVPTTDWETAQGHFEFSVYSSWGNASAAELRADAHPVVAVALAVARAMGLAGFVGLVALAFRTALSGPATNRRPLVRTWWTVTGATVLTLLLFGGYAARTGFWGALDPALVPATWSSDVGAALRARLLGLFVAAVGLRLLLRGAPSRGRAVAVLLGACALGPTFVMAAPHDSGGPAILALVGGALVPVAAGIAVAALLDGRVGLLPAAAFALVAGAATGDLVGAAVVATAGVVALLGGLATGRVPRLVAAGLVLAAVVAVGLLPAGPALLALP
jgi:methionine-rich copper-binding protein CopC